MRTVIYDAEDMEPITVIDVPQRFMWEIESGGRSPELMFPVHPPLSVAAFEPVDRMQKLKIYVVRVRFEPIMKAGRRLMWLATTMDGETALLLRSAFLPGQQGAVERERQKAFLQGFMAAVA